MSHLKSIFTTFALIIFAGALVVSSTGAFFSDTETATGNTFTAGALDLFVDSIARYNNTVCFDTGDSDGEDGAVWLPSATVNWFPVGVSPNTSTTSGAYMLTIDEDEVLEAIEDFTQANEWHHPAAGTPCSGTWALTDLGPSHSFFDYSDLKPGDTGGNSISLHVNTNNAYACAIMSHMEDNDLGLTEPEFVAGDSSNGSNNGELSNELHFFTWYDDGDQEWETEEEVFFSNIESDATAVLDDVVYELYTPAVGGSLVGTQTAYIGSYWCYGTLTVDTALHTLACDGSTVTNITQSDQLKANITFYVEQMRHNADFSCPAINELII